jgi:hypothetical protein
MTLIDIVLVAFALLVVCVACMVIIAGGFFGRLQ